jgi:hypothetical protein
MIPRKKWQSWAIVSDGRRVLKERPLKKHWSSHAALDFAASICDNANKKAIPMNQNVIARPEARRIRN